MTDAPTGSAGSADSTGSAGSTGPADTTGSVDSFDPHALLAGSRLGVLATIKSDGRPQLSPVMPSYDRATGLLQVSTTEGTAKIRNLRRDARTALEVTHPDGMAWATAEGTVTLTGPGSDPHGPEVDALVRYYRDAAGEHPDWDEYRAVMVAERRVLITMRVERVYGATIR
ncbi:PPOX class F420-dependent oxidoreductase [Streptomyces sp. NPDC003006]